MVFLLFTVALAIALTSLELKVHYLPLALATAISWLALAAGVMLGADASFDMGTPWIVLLSSVLVLMAFVPIGHFISQMGKSEITIAGRDGQSYKMWGRPTKAPIISRSAQIQQDHARRLHSLTGRLPTPSKTMRRRVR